MLNLARLFQKFSQNLKNSSLVSHLCLATMICSLFLSNLSNLSVLAETVTIEISKGASVESVQNDTRIDDLQKLPSFAVIKITSPGQPPAEVKVSSLQSKTERNALFSKYINFSLTGSTVKEKVTIQYERPTSTTLPKENIAQAMKEFPSNQMMEISYPGKDPHVTTAGILASNLNEGLGPLSSFDGQFTFRYIGPTPATTTAQGTKPTISCKNLIPGDKIGVCIKDAATCPAGYQVGNVPTECRLNTQIIIDCNDSDRAYADSSHCKIAKTDKAVCPAGYTKEADSGDTYTCKRDSQSTTNYNKLTGWNCEVGESKITLYNLFIPGSFLPIVPEECAVDATTKRAKPLSPALVPDILIRAFGFLAGLIFYLFGFLLVFSGLQLMWDGIGGEQKVKPLRNIQDNLWALFLVLITYSVIMTIVSFLGFNTENTDLKSFFNFG